MKIVFATNNQHKLSEVRQILGDRVEVLSLSDIGCHEDIPETGQTLEENALIKAQYVYDHYHEDCFADDTGLEVDALGGAPGVYSARYAGEGHDSEANMTKLLHELRDNDQRNARFRTVIALIQQGIIHEFEGIVKGKIIRERRGGEGFGYDPIFQPEGYDQTFAEMGNEEKNQISHRARATAKLCEYLSALCLMFCLLLVSPVVAQVGTWRAYMSYYEPQQIVKANNTLFVRASNDLYHYNLTDHSITTYDKITGLSDTYITNIAWNQQASRLIIIYKNSNIDLMDLKGNVTNISALYRKAMTEDKTIDSLTIDGVYAYLYARFGIVKVNMQRAEISDTYTPQHPDYKKQLPAYVNNDWEKYIDEVRTLKPGGPKYNQHGFLRLNGQRIFSVNAVMEQKACIQVFDNDDWTIYENDIEEKIGHRFVGLSAVDVDPLDDTHVMAAGQTGVYEYKNGSFVKEYSNDNSLLQTAATVGNNNKDYVIVTDAKYDSQGNFWCLNSISPSTSLLCLNKSGEWVNHHHEKLMISEGYSMEDMRSMIFASDGHLWFVNNYFRTPAVISYDTNQKQIKTYTSFVNQDGTSYNIAYVRCITEDLDKNLWIGTNLGLFVLMRSDLNAGRDVFTQIKVPRNDGSDYADYLLNGIDINCIAIDEANRKWIGTSTNGAYLISADNMSQLQHFMVDNSAILSNIVKSIAIDSKTGKVFFGTENGLCSYTADATTAYSSMSKDNVYAYPNPVEPDYTGLITIVGLSFNADVKILSPSGKLVAQGRSNGGTFTWDGNDKNGNRVASGIYMVVTATNNGDSGTVCKIAIIK